MEWHPGSSCSLATHQVWTRENSIRPTLSAQTLTPVSLPKRLLFHIGKLLSTPGVTYLDRQRCRICSNRLRDSYIPERSISESRLFRVRIGSWWRFDQSTWLVEIKLCFDRDRGLGNRAVFPRRKEQQELNKACVVTRGQATKRDRRPAFCVRPSIIHSAEGASRRAI